MKDKEEDTSEGGAGRRRSGRLAKARVAKKNTNDEDDQQTPSLANSSQSNTPMASPNISSPSSDLNNCENSNHRNHCSPTVPPSSSSKPMPPIQRPVIAIPKETEPTPPFTRIEENVYLFDRKRSRNHKDKMVCDCILTKEERQRGLTGCGEDCLNRILMMECGSRCPVGNDCANKRFQKRQYVKCEPFRAGKKGWGLRVLERVEPGTFIMEYVGEVVNPSEFKSRVRKCAKEKKEHHYFMALKSDEIIDATAKGNMTRFVNHSCEPSCETQKWTVNGDLRVGFFAIKTLEPGDEVTFNYQFERYGKKAQPCYCETPSCQGVIGGAGTSKIAIDGTRFTAEELEDIKEYDEILEQDKDAFEDLALEAEIEKLCEAGFLKNKRQVMTLARIMLRTEDNEDRMKLLNVLDQTKEPVFRRLFIDYHGLRLLWSWMVDTDNIYVKTGILQVLSVLPIPNKTVLMESKVLEVVERWSTEPDPTPISVAPEITPTQEVGPVTPEENKPKTSETDPDSSVPMDGVSVPDSDVKQDMTSEPKVVSVGQDVPVVDDLGGFQEETSTPVVERAKIKITIISKKEEKKDDPVKSETSDLRTPPNIAVLSRKLLQMWKNLKEAYKIPRLIHKNRKEDEMAADAFEEAEKSAKSDVPLSQDRKPGSDLKPKPYDWIIAPLRSKGADRGSDYINQVNGQMEGPVFEEVPKESKVAHRMNFEMELLKEKYERDMEALRLEAEETKRKLQMMEVQQSSLLYPIPEPNLHDQFEQGMFLRPSVSEPATPFPVDVIDPSSYGQPSDYDSSLAYATEYESNIVVPEYHEEWPRVTVDNLANVVIECTPRNLHHLRSDDEAVVGVDYGIEYVPIKKKKVVSHELFDPSFPAPGIYFDFGHGNFLYTSCMESGDGSCEFKSLLSSSINFDQSDGGEVCGPLTRHWRRARDDANGKSFFYHKRKSQSVWRIPGGPNAVDSGSTLDQELKTTSESIVATADSTSCVGTATATNSPATSSCMNSPPGIFYKAPVNGSRSDPRTKATPDQSSHKKTGKKKKHNLEKFKSEVSEMVKRFLYPYQKEDCRVGKIVSPDDFKHLCKKFTNEIYAKEVKTGKTDLVVTDIVKKKSKGYVKKYMATRGPVFRLGHSPTHEDDNPVSSLMTNDEETTADDDVQAEEFKEGSVS